MSLPRPVCLLPFLLLSCSLLCAQQRVPVWLTAYGWQDAGLHFLQVGDSVGLAVPAGQALWRCQTCDSSHDNLPERAILRYRCTKLLRGPDTLHLRAEALGTQYLGLWPRKRGPDSCFAETPPTQLRVRRDDSYLGYLTELIGVPFVVPPRRLPYGRHQTDRGLGVDCAELAIYGRRRMGEPIPYAGPQGIKRYLRPIPRDSLYEGCVIHFGGQVSVLYRDRARRGQLDPSDELIQAYETWVQIVPWQASGWFGRRWEGYGFE